LNGEGSQVDFWYAFKAPNGWDYYYMDADSKSLQPAESAMNDPGSAVSRTLSQVYDEASSLSYAFWNDETPGGTKVGGPHAHAKGAVAFGSGAGFWLTHSLPAFPKEVGKDGSMFRAASHKFGQSFLCVSIDTPALVSLARLMDLNWPEVYSFANGADIGEQIFKWVTVGKQDKEAPSTLVSDVTSKGGQVFKAFATRGEWNRDLFEDLVSPTFDQGFNTETWQNGRGKLDNYVAGEDGKNYSETNIQQVAFPGGQEWSSTQDHAKCALSMDGHFFCVGHKNRQEGQRHRGGGTVCVEDETIAAQMAKVIKRKSAFVALV